MQLMTTPHADDHPFATPFTTAFLADLAPAPHPAAPAPRPTPPASVLLARALDEVDFGILLADAAGELLHGNHRARQVLAGGCALQLQGNRLHTPDARSLALLRDALRDAAGRGLRRLLDVGRGDERQVLALVPVHPGVAALLLGRTRMCEDLALQCFARAHALTAAETRVLARLGHGAAPAEIAREQGVKISTVRTQISAIRHKTGASNVAALLRRVAGLPPMASALRC